MKFLSPSAFLTALLVFSAGMAAFSLNPSTSALAEEAGLVGIVQPHRVLRLGAARDGLMETVRFDLGDVIEAGEVIATLDVRLARAQADLAQLRAGRDSASRMVAARLADARRRLEAQEALHRDGIATAETVDTVRTEVELEELAAFEQEEEKSIAQLELGRALATLDQATIVSPSKGVVTERHLSPGEYFSRTGQAAVLTLAELDPLVIEINVPVESFGTLQVGHVARVRLDLPGNPVRRATVHTVGRVVDTASRTFRIRLHMSNPDYAFPAGLRCRVHLDG